VTERGRRVLGSTWALGGLAFLLTWGGGLGALLPPSIDYSFHAGLQMAAVEDIRFGPELLVTYGPLGFMKSTLIFEAWPARFAGVYGIALHLGFCLSVLWAARRNFPLAIAFAVTLVAAALARGDLTLVAVRDDAEVIVIPFIWCIAALRDEAAEWTKRLVIYGGGPYAAIELLSKLNTGLIVLAMIAITALAIEPRRPRNAIVVGAGFVVTAGALWLVTGQHLSDVGTFVTGTLEIIRGYSSGARIDYGYDERQYDYPFAIVLFLLAGAAAWLSAGRLPWPRRIAVALITALVVFTTAKGGFVSHEIFHMAVFYATLLGVLIAFPLPERPAIRWGGLAAIVAAAAMGFSTHFPGFPRNDLPDYPMIDPIANVANGAETVYTLATGRLEDEIAERRELLIDRYAVGAEQLAALEGRSVHLDPSETAAVWAHELDWDPLPIFQPYIAWTPELDRRNAEALAAPDGPERILRQNLDALGRFPAWESPAAMLAMLCNFEAISSSPNWQVLARVPDRCGEPRPLETVEATFGDPVPIPKAPRGNIVFARVEGVGVEGIERLRTLLLRAHGRQVQFSNGGDKIWTLIAATAGQGLIMRAPKEIDYPGTFRFAPNAREVTFLYEGGASETPITVEFLAMPVRAAGQ
jgi:hypothetical protein